MSLLDRVTLPTPRFFRKVRAMGTVLAAVGGIIATTPVALPAVVVTLGSYLVLAGSIAVAVSSVAVEPEAAPMRVDGRTMDEVGDIVGRGDAASL